MTTVEQKYQCVDCAIILDTEEDIANSAICEGCNNTVCEECVITDHETYECSECFEAAAAEEEDNEEEDN